MIQTRKNVFETNSSSTHSLVISKKERGYDYKLPVIGGVLTIPFGEFNWGPAVLVRPIDKLSYLITDRNTVDYDWENEPTKEEFESMLYQDVKIQEIIEAVKACCSEVKEIKFEFSDSYSPLGYIDHQSMGTSYEKDLSIEEIVFNNKIIILIDNDNVCYYDDYFRSWDGKDPTKDIEALFRG